MGSQFWWFYDIIAAAAILVMVFLSGRRGIFKSLLHFAGYFLAVIIAFSLSSSISDGLYKNSVRNSNVKKIEKSVNSTDFIIEVKNHIEEEYNFSGEIDYETLQEIYTEKNTFGYSFDKQIYQYVSSIYANKIGNENIFYEKLHKGYADIISSIVSEHLLVYAGETAFRTLSDKPQQMNELIPLLLEPEDRSGAAEYIADKYTAKPYKSLIRLISFLAIIVLAVAVTVFLTNTTFRTPGFQSLGSHIGGGLVGVLLGAVVVVFIAACVRLNVICGEDKMLFFNNEAIDKTYLFRHIYNFIALNL